MNNPPSDALAAFSVDVEDYFQVEALRDLCPRSRWTSFEDRTLANTERILELADRTATRGTFFILGWTAARHPDLVRRISDAGHEIASHGYDHELIYHQDPETFRKDIRRSRDLLQDLSGQDVIGYRAPSYTVVKKTQWALDVLAEEGFQYDSSVFPIMRKRYGIPDAPRWPHTLNLVKGNLVEFPLPTIRFGFVNIPATGGAYLRLLPFPYQRWAIKRLLRHHRPFVVTIHPWELDVGQPGFPVSRLTRWSHYHNLDQAENRLEALLKMARYRSQADVLQTMKLL